MPTTRNNASTNNDYRHSVHILFKLKHDESFFLGTAAIITGKNLPNDNIELRKHIRKLGTAMEEVKIRVEVFNGNAATKKVFVATIVACSFSKNGRIEMEELRDEMISTRTENEAEQQRQQAADDLLKAQEKQAEQQRQQAADDLLKAQEKQAEQQRQAAAALMKAQEELQTEKKRQATQQKEKGEERVNNGPPAKKRLVFQQIPNSASSSLNSHFYKKSQLQQDEELSQKDMFSYDDESPSHSDNESVSDSTSESMDDDENPVLPVVVRVAKRTSVPLDENAVRSGDSTPSRHQQQNPLMARVLDLETENGYLFNQLDEKDLEIEKLQDEIRDLKNRSKKDPGQDLIEKLNVALSQVGKISDNMNNSGSNASAAASNLLRNSTSVNEVMVPLVEGHNLRIEKSQLKMAISIGRLSKENLNGMVNKLLEGLYTRDYMSKRSLSGKGPRVRHSAVSQTTPTKPGLPVDDVAAITSFVISGWKKYHKIDINPKLVRQAIRSKLSTETQAMLLLTPPSTDV